MLYMFLIYSQEVPGGLDPYDEAAVRSGHGAVMADSAARGALRAVARLKPSATATCVRLQDGSPLTLDGPVAETKEVLAGFYILDCADLDEALDWARRIPSACRGASGCIEVRPLDTYPPPLL